MPDVRPLIDHLPAALRDDLAGLPDGRLLDRYLRHRDEAAFEVLLRRHKAMVFGVCRRHLPQADAEDAFQATWLVLVAKAAGLVGKGSLGGWLHGVARNTARKARVVAERRTARERKAATPTPADGDPVERSEALALLDDELARLPDALREAVVLCEIQGVPVREAAAVLGVPVGTLSGRLTTARRRLADRLAARGLDAPAVLSTAAPAAVPAVDLAYGATAETVAREVLAMMLWTQRIKVGLLALAALVAVGGVAVGVTFALSNAPAEPAPAVAAQEEPMPAVEEKPEFPDAKLDVKADAVHPAGVPIVLDVKLTNLGLKPLGYWCGGPGQYPGFNHTVVTVTDTDGKSRREPLSNGQYIEGSGMGRSVESCASIQVPGMLPALPAGRYTLRIGKGEPTSIEVKADAALGRAWDEALVKRVRAGEPFARHVAKEAARPGVLDPLLADLTDGTPEAALNACFALWPMHNLPATASPTVAKALMARLEELKDPHMRRTDVISYLGILAAKLKTDDLIGPLAWAARTIDLGDDTRGRMVDALGEFPQARAKAELIEFLTRSDGRVQFAAAWALAKQEDARALPLLLEHANDKQSPRRAEAFFLLRYFKKDLAVEGVLRKALDDPDKNVADAARRSLQ